MNKQKNCTHSLMNICQQSNIRNLLVLCETPLQSPVMDFHLQIETNPIKCQGCNPDRIRGRKKQKQTNFAFWNFSTFICFLSEISCTKEGKRNIGCIIHSKNSPGTICAFWCQGHRPEREWKFNEFDGFQYLDTLSGIFNVLSMEMFIWSIRKIFFAKL